MKRIFEVTADQGLEPGPGVVYMVIQWGCLAKCQGTRKGGLEFRRVFKSAVASAGCWLFVQKSHVPRVRKLSRQHGPREFADKFSETGIYRPRGEKSTKIRRPSRFRRCAFAAERETADNRARPSALPEQKPAGFKRRAARRRFNERVEAFHPLTRHCTCDVNRSWLR